MNNTNLRKGGFYWQGDKPYLSTTEILKIINKPQLMYWFGREVYYAMLKDPTLDEKTAMGAPYLTTDKAKTRGTTIHSIVEAYKTTGQKLDTIPPEFHKYATAFYEAINVLGIKMIDQEKSLFSEKHKIAGTLDIYGQIGEKFYVIDVKTGKDIYQETGLQLSSYAHMQRETGNRVDEIAVLLLETGIDGKPTGKYKFQTMTESFDAFLNCKGLYEYVNREKLLKVGYLTI